MASISDDPNGRKRILFMLGGKRRVLRLGKLTSRQADAFKVRLEQLVGTVHSGHPPDDETARWLAGLDPTIRVRMERAGLVRPSRGGNATLLKLLDEFAAAANVKPGTRLVQGHARRNLLDYFGAGKLVRDVGPLDGDQWRQWLRDHEELSPATVSRRVKLARQFFAKAIEWEMVERNPFAKVKTGAQTNKARQVVVSRQDTQKVIDQCPDAQWRLLVALSRYGGLRCPSEHLLLKWQDVNWDSGRILVTSPKTEHHEGGGSRLVPLFPELRAPLLEVFELAEPGAEFVITRYRLANSNLRTQLERIIKRAGVKPWPKLFNNLRASRETELEETYPSHVVCAWLGNSPDVARKHYLQVRDSDFERAAADPAAEKAAQNPAQHTAADARNAPHQPPGTNANTPVLQGYATVCDGVQTEGLSPLGLEPRTHGLKVRCSTN